MPEKGDDKMVRMIPNTAEVVKREGETRELYAEFAGLSTDDKPTDGLITGCLFLEVDTGDVYAFAEGDSPTWNKIAALLGSGS